MPGGGKSTVGRHLARRLGIPFNDSDAVIERRLDCTIREYFEQRGGRLAFRDIEQAVIVGPGSRAVPTVYVATGGGVRAAPNQSCPRCANTSTVDLPALDAGRSFSAGCGTTRHSGLCFKLHDPLGRLRALNCTASAIPLYQEIGARRGRNRAALGRRCWSTCMRDAARTGGGRADGLGAVARRRPGASHAAERLGWPAPKLDPMLLNASDANASSIDARRARSYRRS